jgi:hypothetical protein
MAEYLEAKDTKHHDGIVYDVKDYIVVRQGRGVPVEELCLHFYGDYTKSLDTKMRNIVLEISKDKSMKYIISTKDGYMHPFFDQTDAMDQYEAELDSTARSIFYRLGCQKFKRKHDGQFKLPLGKYDNPVYEAFLQQIMIDEEVREKEEAMKPKRHVIRGKRPIEQEEVQLIETEHGQLALGGF